MNVNRTVLGIALLSVLVGGASGEGVRVVPAPKGEPLSKRFTVSVDGQDAPVYVAHVCALTAEKPDVYLHGEAGFASFDMDGKATVTVTFVDKVKTAKLLPSSYGVTPKISGNTVTFEVEKPGQLTLDLNGDWSNSLHVFANPMETEPLNLKDPNLIYFGPGLHAIDPLNVGSGKTVYIAAGAVVYGKVTPEHGRQPVISLVGSNIKLRGRGILDGSLHPKETAPANLLRIKGDSIDVEGVVLRDSSSWNVPVASSKHVTIRNVKIFGWRLNSDGIDVNNSQDVAITDSFVRVFDDLIAVKTSVKGEQESKDITAKRLVLWNEKAHALTVGAEIRENAENILFADCDVIHDKGHDWLFRVFNGDSGTVKNLVYDDIRVEEDRRPFSLWLGRTHWSKDDTQGQIQDVVFRNIRSPKPEWDHPTQLVGFDATHVVQGVVFENVVIGGQPLKKADVEANEFVKDVTVKP